MDAQPYVRHLYQPPVLKAQGIERILEEEVKRYELAGVENCEILSSADGMPITLRTATMLPAQDPHKIGPVKIQV